MVHCGVEAGEGDGSIIAEALRLIDGLEQGMELRACDDPGEHFVVKCSAVEQLLTRDLTRQQLAAGAGRVHVGQLRLPAEAQTVGQKIAEL